MDRDQALSGHDIKVKCTRCRNSHLRSERNFVLGAAAGGGVMSRSACPRCGGYSWYDCTPQVAWCWASGLIEIGDAMPADRPDGGAIQIATGPRYALEGQISALARHGRGTDGHQLIVPDVPEADDQRAAGDALASWLKRCGRSGRKDGVVFSARVAP